MTSSCSDSNGTITLEFTAGTDLQEALIKVNSQLQQVPDYPVDAEEPVIQTSDPNDNAIAWFILGQRVPPKSEADALVAKHPQLKAALTRPTPPRARG